jgi:hypothetical protein
MENAVTMDPNVVSAKQAVIDNAVANQTYNPANTSLTPEAWSAAEGATKKTLADKLIAERATAAGSGDFMGNIQNMFKGVGSLGQEGGLSSLYQNLGGSPMSLLKSVGSAAAPAIGEAMKPKPIEEEKSDADMGQRYGFSMNPVGGQRQVQPGQDPLSNTPSSTTTPFPTPDIYGREQTYFAPSYTKLTSEEAKKLYGFNGGGDVKNEGNTLTPEVAKNLMQTSMTTGTPTLDFERYGGYDKVKALYNSSGKAFKSPQVDVKTEFQDYLKQTVNPPKPLVLSTPDVDSYGKPYSADNPRSPNFNDPLLQPQTTPAVVNPTTELIYDPINQRYTKNPNFVDTKAAEVAPEPYVYTGAGKDDARAGWTKGLGSFKATGGLLDAYAGGGMSHLGDYSDGGRLLRGPGDGVSDSIPAMIGKRQPARLADGEFVVPARIVSELGNGSTEAGARKLYAMMDRIQKARGKTVGKGKVAKNSRSDKYLPA